jgi:hypothetical protein
MRRKPGQSKNAKASVAKLDQPSIGEFAQRFADRFARGANQLCERLVGNSRWELSTVVLGELDQRLAEPHGYFLKRELLELLFEAQSLTSQRHHHLRGEDRVRRHHAQEFLGCRVADACLWLERLGNRSLPADARKRSGAEQLTGAEDRRGQLPSLRADLVDPDGACLDQVDAIGTRLRLEDQLAPIQHSVVQPAR